MLYNISLDDNGKRFDMMFNDNQVVDKLKGIITTVNPNKCIKNFFEDEVDINYFDDIKDKGVKVSLYKHNKAFTYEEIEKLVERMRLSTSLLDTKMYSFALKSAFQNLVSSSHIFVPDDKPCYSIKIGGLDIICFRFIGSNEDGSQGKVSDGINNFLQAIKQKVGKFPSCMISVHGNDVVLSDYSDTEALLYVLLDFFQESGLISINERVRYANSIMRLVIKDLVTRELTSLSNIISVTEDHPLSEYRHLSLQIYEIFNILSVNGELSDLSGKNIKILGDALSYNNDFDDIPPIISRSTDRLAKRLTIKLLERIKLVKSSNKNWNAI